MDARASPASPASPAGGAGGGDRRPQPQAAAAEAVDRNREYEELMDVIQRRGRFGKDAYGALMAKEARVLDTVDRVVNDARLTDAQAKLFVNLSLTQALVRTADVLRDLYHDLVRVRSPRDVLDAFARPERTVYLGVLVIALAVVLMLATALA